MARCPRCTKHFRVMEDEEGMHECPSCGYAPWNEPKCLWCNGELPTQLGHETEEDWLDDVPFYPYCSNDCANAAERDSEEDN